LNCKLENKNTFHQIILNLLDGCCPPLQQVKLITKEAGEGKKEETEMIGNNLHKSTLFCEHYR
jgi:hypothetical protein